MMSSPWSGTTIRTPHPVNSCKRAGHPALDGAGHRDEAERTRGEFQQQEHKKYHSDPQDGDDVSEGDELRCGESESAWAQVADERGDDPPGADRIRGIAGPALVVRVHRDAQDRKTQDGRSYGVQPACNPS